MYDELADESWYVRHSVRLMRRFQRMRTGQRAGVLCGGLLALVVLYALLNALFGLDRVSEFDERASSLYGTLASHTDAFAWEGVADARVEQHVLDARALVSDSRHLTLVSSTKVSESRSRPIECKELFSVSDNSTDVLNALFYRAARFLRENAARQRCVCAPELGHRLRYIAFLAKHDVELARQLQERNGGPETLDVDADGTTVVHMINPEDELAAVYDALDDTNAALPDLSVVEERQATRYNDAYRGNSTFAILRRERLRVKMKDRQCHSQSVQVKGELAYCVQRCFDLLLGLGVARRAEQQFGAGVRLNSAMIEAHAQPRADRAKDEL